MWLQRGRVLWPQVFLVANRTQDNMLILQLRSIMAATLRTDMSLEATLTENFLPRRHLGSHPAKSTRH